MEEGTKKKQRKNSSHWKNISTHISLSSYCTSSSHSSWLQQYLPQWAESQPNCSQTPAWCDDNDSKNLGKGWEGRGDKNRNSSAWSILFITKNRFVSKLSSPAVVETQHLTLEARRHFCRAIRHPLCSEPSGIRSEKGAL